MGIPSQLDSWILERAYQGFLSSKIGCMDVLPPAELATAPHGCMLIIIPLAVTGSLMVSVQQCRAAQGAQISQGFWQYSSSILAFIPAFIPRMDVSSWSMIRKQTEWQTGNFKSHSYLMASRLCIWIKFGLWFIVYLLWASSHVQNLSGSYSGSLLHGHIIMSDLWNS